MGTTVSPQSLSFPGAGGQDLHNRCFFSDFHSSPVDRPARRTALDFAIKNGYTHGGGRPRGREAEVCLIPPKYQLAELVDGCYRQRTRRNVQDSDGTLIINLGELEGGSLATQVFAQKQGKPHLLVPLDAGVTEVAVANVLAWLREHAVTVLNVAGPARASVPASTTRPSACWLPSTLLCARDRTSHRRAGENWRPDQGSASSPPDSVTPYRSGPESGSPMCATPM